MHIKVSLFQFRYESEPSVVVQVLYQNDDQWLWSLWAADACGERVGNGFIVVHTLSTEIAAGTLRSRAVHKSTATGV